MAAQTRNLRLLTSFYLGSTIILCISIVVCGAWISSDVVRHERSRAQIAQEQLSYSIESETRGIAQEIFTQNYEAINLRVRKIAELNGGRNYELRIRLQDGRCVFSSSSDPCQLSKGDLNIIDRLAPGASDSHPSIAFDQKANQYQAVIKLTLASEPLGELFVKIDDAYGFYRGNTGKFILQVVLVPILVGLLIWSLWLFASRHFINRHYAFLSEFEKVQALGEQAARFAHNIRAPLSALNASSSHGLQTSEQIALFRRAVARIEDIASELLRQRRGAEGENTSCTPAAVSLFQIADETRAIAYNQRVQIILDLGHSVWNKAIPMKRGQFSQVISNLVSNSVDACTEVANPTIRMSAKQFANNIEVTIDDNGHGIPKDVLLRLRKENFSHGKVNGTGLGLKYVKETVQAAGGTVELDSKVDSGTRVNLKLPIQSVMNWLAEPIALKVGATLVALDDDPNIHSILKRKLGEQIKLLSFMTASQLLEAEPPNDSFYFIDYDLGDPTMKGTEVISRLGLEKNVFVVTDRFDDPKVQKLCQDLHVKLLPKPLLAEFPIIIHNSNIDAVIIDDDVLIHMSWRQAAKNAGKQIATAKSEQEFRQLGIPYHTKIYIDKNLGNGVSGIELAKRLHDEGYLNLYLATGEYDTYEPNLDFIKGLQGKDFPNL